MPRTQTLYDRAVDICTDYLGPAGERFIRRQIATHLKKEPEELARGDLPELTKWVRLAFAMLTDEAEVTDAVTARLAALSKPASSAIRRHNGTE